MPETTRSYPGPGDSFAPSIAAHLREQIAVHDRVLKDSIYRESHAEALRALADHAQALEQGNPLLSMLWNMSAQLGDSDRFVPGPEQNSLIHRAGTTGPEVPKPEDFLAELIAAGYDDVVERLNNRGRTLGNEAKRDYEVRSAAAEDQATAATAELLDARAELDAARREIERTAAEREFLLSLVETDVEGEEAAKPRRQRVPEHDRIYECTTANGATHYEVGYRKDGKQRWRRVGPDLSEAVRVRDELAAAT